MSGRRASPAWSGLRAIRVAGGPWVAAGRAVDHDADSRTCVEPPGRIPIVPPKGDDSGGRRNWEMLRSEPRFGFGRNMSFVRINAIGHPSEWKWRETGSTFLDSPR